MTENEAIKRVKEFGLHHAIGDLPYSVLTVKAFEMAIEALKEIQKYRAIGTIKEINDILQIISEGQDDVYESGISTGLLHTLLEYAEYSKIGTVEECQKARERQRAKKPIKDEYNHDCCPNCGWIVYQNEWGGRYLPHCENCGQAIDWSELSR